MCESKIESILQNPAYAQNFGSEYRVEVNLLQSLIDLTGTDAIEK